MGELSRTSDLSFILLCETLFRGAGPHLPVFTPETQSSQAPFECLGSQERGA